MPTNPIEMFVDETLPKGTYGDGTRKRPCRSIRHAIYAAFAIHGVGHNAVILPFLPRAAED